jgi:hypothetical protein
LDTTQTLGQSFVIPDQNTELTVRFVNDADTVINAQIFQYYLVLYFDIDDDV